MNNLKRILLCLGMLTFLASCQKLEDPSTPPIPPNVTSSYPYVPRTSSDENPPIPAPNPGLNSILDPLTNGTSVGTVSGGVFTSEGFTVTTNSDGYIAYSTGIFRNIRVEFDARGYRPQENDGADGKLVILEIFDSSHEMSWEGDAWLAPYYMYHFRRRGITSPERKVDGVELKFGGRGIVDEYSTWDGNSPVGHPLSWDSNMIYHWVITIYNGHSEITRNGQVIFSVGCEEFSPGGPLNVRIGGVPYGGRTGSKGVTYSNVIIQGL